MSRYTLTTPHQKTTNEAQNDPHPQNNRIYFYRLAISTPTQQHQHQSEGAAQNSKEAPSRQPNSPTGMHFPGRSLSGAKRQRQSTLATSSQPAKHDPKMDPQRILQQPPQQSAWFQNFKIIVRECIESGVARWFGSLKGITEKQRKQCKQYLEITAEETLTATQQQALNAAAVSWGVPFKAIEKFTAPALVKLVAIITQMTE